MHTFNQNPILSGLILSSCLAILFLSTSPLAAQSPITPPTKLSDLDCLQIGVLDVTKNTDVKASFASIFSTEYSKNSERIVQNFIKFKDIKLGDSTVRIFVGIRLYISINNIKISGNLTLSQIAAAVTLGKAKASYKFQIIGFPNIDYSGLPPTSNFDATTYNQVRNYFDTLVQKLTDATIISPKITSITKYSRYNDNDISDLDQFIEGGAVNQTKLKAAIF